MNRKLVAILALGAAVALSSSVAMGGQELEKDPFQPNSLNADNDVSLDDGYSAEFYQKPNGTYELYFVPAVQNPQNPQNPKNPKNPFTAWVPTNSPYVNLLLVRALNGLQFTPHQMQNLVLVLNSGKLTSALDANWDGSKPNPGLVDGGKFTPQQLSLRQQQQVLAALGILKGEAGGPVGVNGGALIKRGDSELSGKQTLVITKSIDLRPLRSLSTEQVKNLQDNLKNSPVESITRLTVSKSDVSNTIQGLFSDPRTDEVAVVNKSDGTNDVSIHYKGKTQPDEKVRFF